MIKMTFFVMNNVLIQMLYIYMCVCVCVCVWVYIYIYIYIYIDNNRDAVLTELSNLPVSLYQLIIRK